MPRISIWTKIGRYCRSLWRRRLNKLLQTINRPRSKNRYKPLGTKKRFRVVSRRPANSSWVINRKKKRRIRRGGNYHTLQFVLATMLCAVVMPFELIGKLLSPPRRKTSKKSTSTPHKMTHSANSSKHTSGSKHTDVPPRSNHCPSSSKDEKYHEPSFSNKSNIPIVDDLQIKQDEPQEKVFDENTPKSVPKGDKDQYIRKRMVIAGSYYCKHETISKLKIGTYFDLIAEPSNPHDKNAVALLYEGEKIGYIPQKDNAPFVISLKLGRKLYGVITDIIYEDKKTLYEFETWYDNSAKQ